MLRWLAHCARVFLSGRQNNFQRAADRGLSELLVGGSNPSSRFASSSMGRAAVNIHYRSLPAIFDGRAQTL